MLTKFLETIGGCLFKQNDCFDLFEETVLMPLPVERCCLCTLMGKHMERVIRWKKIITIMKVLVQLNS